MRRVFRLVVVVAFFGVLVASDADVMMPMEPCQEGRITAYTGWESGGACSFGAWNGDTGYGYQYSAAPNEDFYDHARQCGVCYELVGPAGATRIIVADMCPISGNEPCDGSMHHFDLSDPTFPLLAEESLGIVNITYRMVSCDVEGNLKIRVKDGSSVWWLSILVFNHRVGIDKLEISENGGSSWTEVTRADYNEFEISRQPGNELQLPLIVRVTGFTDDQISIDLPAIEGDEIIDSGSQFPAVPEGYGGSSNQCCSPQDEFTVVYEDSLGLGWMDGSWGTTNNFAYTQSTHDGSKCIQSVINAWGGLQLLNNVGGPSDQYESLDFWIKASQAIDSGISVWLDDKVHVTTPAVTTSWQLFSFNMTVLDPDERIFGFSVQNGNTALTLYFDSIEFVIDPDAPTTKECADGVEGGTSLGISVSPVYALCAFCICCLILASSSLL